MPGIPLGVLDLVPVSKHRRCFVGAGSTCGSVTGSVPVANAPRSAATHRTEMTAAFRIRALKQNRIHFPGRIAFSMVRSSVGHSSC